MFLRVETIAEKKVLGKQMITNLALNNMPIIFQSFMPCVKNIVNRVNADIISMQIYNPALDLNTFNANTNFQKWAACEVTTFDNHLPELETFIILSGLYAIFLHKGNSMQAAQTFGYIFGTWLPESVYVLDNRPHFEILGSKYIRNSSESEEEVWIPIKPKY
jgi:AraC family transcriptional regulator